MAYKGLYFCYYTVNLAESHFCGLLFYGGCHFDAARLCLFVERLKVCLQIIESIESLPAPAKMSIINAPI